MGKITDFIGQKDQDDEPLIISEPSNFRHESSIGWSKESGFEVLELYP